MTIKKGLGSIPKSLAWLNLDEPITPRPSHKTGKRKKNTTQKKAASEISPEQESAAPAVNVPKSASPEIESPKIGSPEILAEQPLPKPDTLVQDATDDVYTCVAQEILMQSTIASLTTSLEQAEHQQTEQTYKASDVSRTPVWQESPVVTDASAQEASSGTHPQHMHHASESTPNTTSPINADKRNLNQKLNWYTWSLIKQPRTEHDSAISTPKVSASQEWCAATAPDSISSTQQTRSNEPHATRILAHTTQEQVLEHDVQKMIHTVQTDAGQHEQYDQDQATAHHQEVRPENACQKGLPSGWTRATFIVDQEVNEKLKALAYWDRLTVKEIVHEALTRFLQGREIKPIPPRKSLF